MTELAAAVEGAVERGAREPAEAARTLLTALFDPRRTLGKPLVASLRAIADRTIALGRGAAPPGAGAAAQALGDDWFQCPHCADVFEGAQPACGACGKPLAIGRAAIVLDLGDGARLWVCPASDARRPSGAEVECVAWLRAECDAAWFELLDERGRVAAQAAVQAKVALPPNVEVVGVRDGDRTLLVHATKYAVHVVERGVLRAAPVARSATELVVAELTEVLARAIAKPAAEVATQHRRDASLEDAILRDPDAPEAYLVYADWLQTAGDPRGELIALQHGGETARAEALLDAHAPHFFGAVAGARGQLVRHSGQPLGRATTWRWGYLEALWLSAKQDAASIEVPEALAALLDHPSCRFLRELTLGIVTLEDNSYDEVIEVLAARRLPVLHALVLGDFISEETELNWSSLGDVAPLYAAVPDLRALTLRSGNMRLGEIALPSLRALTIRSGGLDLDSLAAIARAPWPNLVRLDVQLGNEADFTADHVAPLLDPRALPRVTHLGLGNSMIGDALADAIARSPLAAQLVGLDLSKGTLGDAGAQALAAAAAAGRFPRLASLDVGDSFLTEAGVGALAGVAPRVEIGDQHDDDGDPENRYISAYE